MSIMDKIKGMFSGGSDADAHAGHDHSDDHGHDHGHDQHDHAAHEAKASAEPYEPPAVPVDPLGTPMVGGMPESVPDPEPGADDRS
jgi:hypothetical protein